MDDIKAPILDLFSMFSEGSWDNPERILRSLHDDAIWWVAGSLNMSGALTKQQMLGRLSGLAAVAATGLKITAQSWIVEANKAAVEAVSELDFRDGRRYRNSYHFVFEIKDHKISLVKEYMDTDHVRSIFESI